MSRRPLGLIGMLGLVAVVELGFASRRDDLVSPLGWAWRHAGSASTREARSCEVLCFGDSQVMMGVLPRLLGDEDGGSPAYNLAIPGGQAPSSYFLLKRALDAGARPKAVIVDFKAKLLDVDYNSTWELWPEIAGPSAALDLARSGGDPSFFGSTLLPRYLPSLAARPSLRPKIAAWMRGERPSSQVRRDEWVGGLAYRQNIQANLGAAVGLAREAPATRDEALSWVRASFPEPWRPRPLMERYVHKFLDLAQSRGITVYWLIPPLYPDAQDRFAEAGHAERYLQFVARVAADHPGVVVLNASESAHVPELFCDVTHLGRSGAIGMSRALRGVLAQPTGETRWVDLAIGSGNDAGLPVEGMEASKLAVRTQIRAERARR